MLSLSWLSSSCVLLGVSSSRSVCMRWCSNGCVGSDLTGV